MHLKQRLPCLVEVNCNQTFFVAMQKSIYRWNPVCIGNAPVQLYIASLNGFEQDNLRNRSFENRYVWQRLLSLTTTLSFTQESVQKFLKFDTYLSTLSQNLLDSSAIATPSKLEHQKL